MAVIDFRLRPATPEMMAGMKSSHPEHEWHPATVRTDDPVAEMIAEMDKLGIERAVMPGRDIEATLGFRIPNEHIAELVGRYPDRLVGVAGVDPNKRMAALREVERARTEFGFLGISMDPYNHRLPANHKWYYPIYARCVQLDLVVFITSAFRYGKFPIEHSSALPIDEVARDFPELTIVVSHGCYPYVLEMIGLAYRHKNVYFEFSDYELMPGATFYVEAANDVVPKKVLYASAYPYIPSLTEHLSMFRKLPFTAEALERVLCRNAVDLLDARR